MRTGMEIMESGESPIGGKEERIYVSVRVRPMNDEEITNNDVSDWECINDDTIVYQNVSFLASERSMYPTAYTFDRVFSSDCSTREVYEQRAKDVAISVVCGINSTVFAYGETSSGKTYTMTGIIEYAIADIYKYIQKHSKRDFTLKFSAMEIYNESVRDLLSSDSTPLKLVEDPERGTTVEKLTEEILRDHSHATELLSISKARRHIGETALNEMSSKLHHIIRLTVESSSREFLGRNNTSTLVATVNFVDLAGSERASRPLSGGTRLREGSQINRSLLTLETVIRKLSKDPNGHIPYRDSKLTRILQPSLGGNSRTALICTMSPARTHVDQSRNTLIFASCAKEVTTKARVNIVMSDKALVKHLQTELARLESKLKNSARPSKYSAILREKDAQIEKLEKEIKDLILQRDIAQSQVKEFIQILGDDASSVTTQVGFGHYPHLRVQKSPDFQIGKQETSPLIDPSLDVDNATFSRSNSEEHVKVPFFDDSFEHCYTSPRILLSSSSNSSVSGSYHVWGDAQSTREVSESNYSSFEDSASFPVVRLHVNTDTQEIEKSSRPLVNDAEKLASAHPMDDNEVMNDIPSNEGRCSTSPIFKEANDFSTIQYLDMASLESPSLAKDSFGNKSLDLTRCYSCRASFTSDSSSPWFKTSEYGENTPAVGLEKENVSGTKIDASPEIFSSDEGGISRRNSEMSEKAEIPTEEVIIRPAKETAKELNVSPKKNVKDVGLDAVEDECKGLTSWPVEFRRLQREIIELWHACNVSLVHRTYFFLLFQGDPSDAIYLEVEMRRMKFLRDKFARGDKTIVDGRTLTLSSSAKALRQERRTLSEQMSKKFSEQERENLFNEWGIGLNTKLRRLQLAHRVWSKTDDINHITESAFLVAKLVGLIDPRQAPNKEMFGLKFAPKSSTGICTFKRSLVSLL